MKQVFVIDGGAGRVVSAIPALLKFHRLNPNEEWYVLVPGWDTLYWSIPILQDRTFNPESKGIFENIVLNADIIHSPEPYRVPGYLRQQLSIVQAFDEVINKTKDHSDLEPPELKFNKQEKIWASTNIANIKAQHKKTKTIVFQPFGSSAGWAAGDVFDSSIRSMNKKSFLLLAEKLSKNYNVIFFGEGSFKMPEDTFTHKIDNISVRDWGAIIDAADYFVGVDSVGQHMARSVGKPGTVIYGSTFPVNTSYPDYFQVWEKPGIKKYSPLRLSELESGLANRINEGLMDLTEKEVKEIFDIIVADIEKKK
jgi:hypothetical protein